MSNSADFGDVRTAQKESDSGGVRVTTSNELLGRRFHAVLVARDWAALRSLRRARGSGSGLRRLRREKFFCVRIGDGSDPVSRTPLKDLSELRRMESHEQII